jgi:Zn-finger nucleic acid-binding protein
MNDALARDPSMATTDVAVEAAALRVIDPPRTTTLYRPFTGEPVEAEMLEAGCPRCGDVWEWPLGLDANLDRRTAEGVVVDVCPSCLDGWADERAVEEGWA